MARLEDLTPNTSVRGIAGEAAVTIVAVQWFETQAAQVTYNDPAGNITDRLPCRDDEPNLEIVEAGGPWSFGVGVAEFHLGSEAHDIRFAHLSGAATNARRRSEPVVLRS